MVIDQLEAGGAQRQFCLLATSLRRAGLYVEVFTLRPESFFGHLLEGIPSIQVTCLAARNRLLVFVRLWRSLRRVKPTVVVSFLTWPNLLVELCRFPRRNFGIVISERNTDVAPISRRRRLRIFLHRLADAIVSNSDAQARVIGHVDPLLKPRVIVIHNAVDTDHFRPPEQRVVPAGDSVRILVLARVAPQKNPLRLVEAIGLLRTQEPALAVHVDWYGKPPLAASTDSSRWARGTVARAQCYFRKVEAAISRHGLERTFRFHAPVEEVRSLYHQSDALCLPSLYEGYPNVVAEAMASGVPVLASAVGDTASLVDHGRSGFLFNPASVDEIANTIVRFARLSTTARHRLGATGRAIAESLSSVDAYARKYIELVRDLESRRSRS